MKFYFTVFILFCSTFTYAQTGKRIKIKKGVWIAQLQLNNSDVLPFQLEIVDNNTLTVLNGDERIRLSAPEVKNDSIHVRFPFFNSEMVFKLHKKKSLSGYWINYNKGNNYRIPLEGKSGYVTRFATTSKGSCDVNGRWKITFEPGTESAYPAVGIFEQQAGSNRVFGTFLTETGDYRFLEGNCSSDSMFLSCFDGSHAFLFKARKSGDSLYGQFFSGKHWSCDWVGEKNANFELPSPESLTYVKEDEALRFSLKTLAGEEFNYPNPEYNGKVVIIQIMGSWCPNCLDETQYYKSLYTTYHSRGLEVISIGYETGESFEEWAANITRLKNKLNLDFTFLVGGPANKGLASDHFKMLNEVISFPTSIFIGRDGQVKRVHTGFNGPGTGAYYQEYVSKTNALIESMLSQ
jgi:thiol-disulfide isomerase/thioredoxin